MSYCLKPVWLVLHVVGGQEPAVAQKLQEQGYRIEGQHSKSSGNPQFPRYLFVRCQQKADCSSLQLMRGVRNVVPLGQKDGSCPFGISEGTLQQVQACLAPKVRNEKDGNARTLALLTCLSDPTWRDATPAEMAHPSS